MIVKNFAKNPRILAAVSVLIWAYLAVVITMLSDMPPFEVLSFSAAIGFIATSVQLTFQKKWHLVKAPLEMWVVGVVFLFGANICYIHAFQLAPPVHAEIINYSWPILVVMGGAVFFREQLRLRHIIGITICVCSLFVLHFDHLQGVVASLNQMYGYAFALAAAFSYAIFILVSKKHCNVPSQIVGLYAGVGAVMSLVGHLLFEHTVMPSSRDIILLLISGFSSHWLSYQIWDYAVKKLMVWEICVISYFTPVLSVAMLTLAGFGVFSWAVVVSCILLFFGSMLASQKIKIALI